MPKRVSPRRGAVAYLVSAVQLSDSALDRVMETRIEPTKKRALKRAAGYVADGFEAKIKKLYPLEEE